MTRLFQRGPAMVRAGVSGGAGASLVSALVSSWHLDEAGTGARNDTFGTNNLTNNAGATQSPSGPPFNPLSTNFAAASLQFLSIASNPTLVMAGTPFSFTGWFYLADKTAPRAMFSKGTQAGTYEYVLNYLSASDRFTWNVENAAGSALVTATANAFGSPLATTFYFLACGWDGANVWVSVNSGARDTAALATGAFSGTGTFAVGKDVQANAGYLNGRAAAVACWKRSLSPADVAALYNAGTGRFAA